MVGGFADNWLQITAKTAKRGRKRGWPLRRKSIGGLARRPCGPKNAWAETRRTYLGMLAEGFPNMLMVLGLYTARGNIPQAVSHSVEFQVALLRFMQQHDYTRVATRPEKVDEWTRVVIKAGEALLSFKVNSWQNGVNRNVEGRTVRRVLGYNGNGAHFRRTTDEVAKGGYQEFAFR